jgi:hypothetical protein
MSQGDKGARTTLEIIIGPRNCPTCLNPKRSALHRELCEAGA